MTRRPEFIGHARAADHREALIDQQQFTVISVEVADPAPPAQAIVETQLDPGLGQALTQRQCESETAVIIEQAPDAHSALGRRDQRLDDGFGAGAGLDQVQLQFDLLCSSSDMLEHARKELRAVDQQFETVAVTPGEHRTAHVSAP